MRRTVLFLAVGTLAMAVLLPCLALVRDTTAHDWYAARKLTLTEAMLAVGFDPYKATVYRTPDGATMRINRFALVVYGEPIRARSHILTTAGDHAVLGAIAGAIGAALYAVVFVGARWSRCHRSGVPTTSAVPGLAAHRETWTRFGDIAGVSRDDGSRTGLLVGRIVRDGAGLDDHTARSVHTPPALPAAGQRGAAVREARVPARPKPGKGGGGDWL